MSSHTSRFLCKRHPSHNAIGVCHLCLEKHLHDLIIKRREQELEGSKNILRNHQFVIEHIANDLSNGQPKHHPKSEAHKENPKDRVREEHGFMLDKAKLHWRGDGQGTGEDGAGAVVRDRSRTKKGDECVMMRHGGKVGELKEDPCGEKMMSMEQEHGRQGRRSRHYDDCNKSNSNNTNVTTTNSAKRVNNANATTTSSARSVNVMKKSNNRSVIDREPNQPTIPSSSSSSSITAALSSASSSSSNSESTSSRIIASARRRHAGNGDTPPGDPEMEAYGGGNQPRLCSRSGVGTPEQDILEAVNWSSCGSYRRLHVELEEMREIIGSGRAKEEEGGIEYVDLGGRKVFGEPAGEKKNVYRRIHADVDEYGPSIRNPMIGSKSRRRRSMKKTMPPPPLTTQTLTLYDLLLQEDQDRTQNRCRNRCQNRARLQILQEEVEEKRPCSASLGPHCDHIFSHFPYHHLHYYHHHPLSSRTPPSR